VLSGLATHSFDTVIHNKPNDIGWYINIIHSTKPFNVTNVSDFSYIQCQQRLYTVLLCIINIKVKLHPRFIFKAMQSVGHL